MQRHLSMDESWIWS